MVFDCDDPALIDPSGDVALLACLGDRPENEGDGMGLARRVPLGLTLQPGVEVVGLQVADALLAALLDETAGHDVEDAGPPLFRVASRWTRYWLNSDDTR